MKENISGLRTNIFADFSYISLWELLGASNNILCLVMFVLSVCQHDSLPQQPNSGQVEKLKLFKTMLELAITFLQVKSIAPNSLSSAISDIGSVLSMTDRIAGSAPGNGSRAVVREDLVTMTNCHRQVKNFMSQDGANGIRKMKRYTRASETSDLESTATSRIKRPRVEFNPAFLEEIREINQQLIDKFVDINDEDVDPSTADADSLLQLERVILILFTYNSKESEDLSVKAKRFSISLRSLSQPMSLGAITRTWDVCALLEQ